MEIKAKINTNIKKESIEILKDGRYSINVNADRKAGKANERTLEIIAGHFNVDIKKVKLIRGHTSQTKTFLVNKE